MKLVLCNLQLTAYIHAISACKRSRAAGYPIEIQKNERATAGLPVKITGYQDK